MNVGDNPLVKSPYVQGDANAGFNPVETFYLITELGERIITESGDYMIAE